jgi:hypothetical protein
MNKTISKDDLITFINVYDTLSINKQTDTCSSNITTYLIIFIHIMIIFMIIYGIYIIRQKNDTNKFVYKE